MRARWNEPLVERDVNFIEKTPDGLREGIKAAFCNEDIEMFRQGYKCIDCWEPLESPFPEECFVCGFPCREFQSQLFAERFAGVMDRKAQINEQEELEILERQRHERERKAGLKSKGIVIPRGVNL